MFSLDTAAFARGHPVSRRFRGAVQGGASTRSPERPMPILFIDEVHATVGAARDDRRHHGPGHADQAGARGR